MQSSQAGDVVGLIFGLAFIVVIIALVLFVWGTIFRKAGYSFWMALLMFVPLVNFIWVIIFAFSKWPIQRQLEELQQRNGVTGGFPVMPPPVR